MVTSHRVILRLTAGPTKGREFVFDEHDTFLFGRAPDCHVFIPDDVFVSRHHFLLEVAPPDVRLRDLGSLNGTAVNGRVLGGRQGQNADPAAADVNQVNLRDGDTVQVGQTSFEVIVEARLSPGATGDHGAADKSTVRGTAPFEPPEGYVIDRELGRGAASIVYLARRLADDAPVAIKFVPVTDDASADARRLFLREIETVRVLKHPNIVAFSECGATRSVLYLAMEYCDQGNVSAFMTRRGGKLSVNLSVAVALHALRGLHYAHTRGVVHRDVKPENVLLHENNKRWTAKIADFGLAKCLDLAGLSGLTATGDFGGTLPFMPREQLTQYRHVGPASDVWGMGATLYHMITGLYPRRGKPGQDPLDVVLNGEQVGIEDCDIEVPPAVAEVIGKAVEPEAAKRFANAGEFHAALKKAV